MASRGHCAVYARTATDVGSDRGLNPISAQRGRAATYVVSRRSEGWEIHPERYDDRGCSGLNVDRPGLRRLLQDAMAGKFEMVVMSDIDRLTRSQADLLRIVEVLHGAGVWLATAAEELSTSTPMGRMTLNLLLNTCRHSLRQPS